MKVGSFRKDFVTVCIYPAGDQNLERFLAIKDDVFEIFESQSLGAHVG